MHGMQFMVYGVMAVRLGGGWKGRLTPLFLLRYSSGMTVAKRKISVSLDEDLVLELDD